MTLCKVNESIELKPRKGFPREHSTLQGDNVPPLYTNEDIYIYVKVTDSDGIINKVNMYVDDKDYSAQPYFVLQNLSAGGLNTNTYNATLHYKGKDAANVTFSVTGTDDYNESATGQTTFYIIKPDITSDIRIVNEASISKKEDRYIEFDLSQSKTNGISSIDYSKAVIQYKTELGEWINISGSQNFTDNNIRVYYPNMPSKSKISTYFKEPGNYTIRAMVEDVTGNRSEWFEKNITIIPDLSPSTQFSLLTPQQRITEDYILNNSAISSVVKSSNIGKGFFKYNDMAISPDGDILDRKIISFTYDKNLNGYEDDTIYTVTVIQNAAGYQPTEEIVVQTNASTTINVRDVNNFKLTFLTELNELGDYYFKSNVKELITQLPPVANPLYNEIKLLEKEAESDWLYTSIDNIAPSISFEVESTKTINLIVQFDTTPTAEEEQKINDIITQLQLKGIKVNVVKKYNQY